MEKEFFQHALNGFEGIWSAASLGHLARFDVPHDMLGRRYDLLKGDINTQWVQWFTESLVDPLRFTKNDYAFIFKEVWDAVNIRFYNKTKDEKQEIASTITKIAKRFTDAFDQTRKRSKLSLDERRLLLDISGPSPHCWICGAVFREQAIDNFIFRKSQKIAPSGFVDILKPRGLVGRDFAIEIDHVVPFSKGGMDDDNLRLACGWCNRNKGAYTSIYGVEGQPRIAGPNELGITSLPQLFWIVRLLALVRKCEHPNGCDRTVENTEMTIVPINNYGALNPTNLRVVCCDHDTLGSKRLQPVRVVEALWS
jgi:5-methylcytosine-specific restriction endonuclease McrA